MQRRTGDKVKEAIKQWSKAKQIENAKQNSKLNYM
jgi:hypothetical protein